MQIVDTGRRARQPECSATVYPQVLTTVPVRKPKRAEFFRVHPNHILDTHLLERDTGMEKESYPVTPEVQHLVVSELRPVRLFTAITKHGTVFLWPVKMPTAENDNLRRISNSALQGAETARRFGLSSSGIANLALMSYSLPKGIWANRSGPNTRSATLSKSRFMT